MTRRTLLLAAMALAAAATSPASADVYYVTYTGTASGTDTNGVFGTAGAVLDSVAFTSTYTYDPSLFGNADQTSTRYLAAVNGGSAYGAGINDPLLSATLAINGHIFQQGSSFIGAAFVYGTIDPPSVMEDAFSSGSNELFNDGDVDGSTIVSLTAVQSFAILPDNQGGALYYDGETISLDNIFVSVTDGPPATVPEPASLALLGGAASVFGLALGIRRRIPAD